MRGKNRYLRYQPFGIPMEIQTGNSHYKKLKAAVMEKRNTFIAPSATVLGQVTLHEGVSVWYNAVIRADQDTITIGAHTNVQDGCIFHVDKGFPVSIGERNVIGHAAIIHGATIGHGNLIGMRATVMNGAIVGNECIIGAHALVTEGMQIPDRSLVLGMPAKVVRKLTAKEVQAIQEGVGHYRDEMAFYLAAEPSA